jgi:hypothetical protein
MTSVAEGEDRGAPERSHLTYEELHGFIEAELFHQKYYELPQVSLSQAQTGPGRT